MVLPLLFAIPDEAASKGEQAAGLQTPPNSYADPSLFQKAMEERLRDLNKVSFPAEGGGSKSGASASAASSLPRPPPVPPMPTEDDIDRLLEQVSLQGGGGGGSDAPSSEDDLLPVMEHMMQSLLSKELLYPAVKDLAEKYPQWLADNRSELSEEDFDR